MKDISVQTESVINVKSDVSVFWSSTWSLASVWNGHWNTLALQCECVTGSIKVWKLHKGKNNVIRGFIRSLVLNTSTLAPHDGWNDALPSGALNSTHSLTHCYVLMIVILLLNLLFRSM